MYIKTRIFSSLNESYNSQMSAWGKRRYIIDRLHIKYVVDDWEGGLKW